jgi:hypothetical protein
MTGAEQSKSAKVGIMISAPPRTPQFEQGFKAAEQALREGAQVYVYWIDSGVEGLNDARLAELKKSGAHLFACAYSLQHRRLNAPCEATLSGLTILSDIMASVDRFESFN